MATDYYIDVVPEDYEEGGRYWKPPIFKTGDYAGAVPIPIGMTNYEIPDDALAGIFDDIAKPFKAVAKTAAKVGGDIIHTANQAARLPAKAVSGIPVVGKVASTVLNVANPYKLVTGLADAISRGERIDTAFLNTAKERLHDIKDVAPYVQAAMSFVPGVGTTVAAAMAAGTALAEGRTITDALTQSVVAALPGGSVAKGAFSAAEALASGDKITDAAMKVAEQRLSPQAFTALKVAKSVSGGNRIKALEALSKNLPPAEAKALRLGTAFGVARTIQSKTLAATTKGKGAELLSKAGSTALKTAAPVLRTVHAQLPSAQKKGAETAAGLLAQKGVNAHQIVALRSVLPTAQKQGFDALMKAAVDHANPSFTSVVSRGMVLRGNWVAARANDKGAVKGRHIGLNGKMTAGHFKRV